jgi:hypothetical protein
MTPITILRDLCRRSDSSWNVSDVRGRVTLIDLWGVALEERLGLDEAAANSTMADLIARGGAIQDFGRRVDPRRKRPAAARAA